MVTTVTNNKCFEFRGLSTDTKPVGTYVGNGSQFLCMDTSEIFFFDEANQTWLKFGAEN